VSSGEASSARARRPAPRQALLAAALGAVALVGGASVATAAEARCAVRDPLRTPHFGDLHVHTRLSLDASTQGTRNRPADAYRFARGARLGIQPYAANREALRSVALDRPLDFAAVTDHAELLGEARICTTPGLAGHESLVCRVYRRWPRVAFFWMNFTAARGQRAGFCGEGGANCLAAAADPWREIQAAAEAAYDRTPACGFTTFVAYEWTGAVGPGNNFHRNVIFAGDAVPERPISFVDAPQLSQLWARLRGECTESGSGCDVVVIPHNSNLGGGLMFATERPDGSPITADDARERARFETLVEIMQHKGDSECGPAAAANDELCGFEKLAMDDFAGRYLPALADPPQPRQFVRHALTEGLAQAERLGVNPFQYGIVASTDTHLGTPGLVAETAAYPGHGGAGAPAGDRLPTGLPDAIDFNPGGLAVLWAEENTRESLFAAMQRREAYGTSGPRIGVRFFGGWAYPPDACERDDFARAGYAGGVPMGGVLPAPPDSSPERGPRFAVSAWRDPGTPTAPGTPLERIQIVKGWVEDGAHRERIFDVAGSRDARANVDPDTCRAARIGPDTLCAVWQDPAFDPAKHAWYYARVVESPTCRWSQQLCVERGVRCDADAAVPAELAACCEPEHRRVIRERAWTSPIWYRP